MHQMGMRIAFWILTLLWLASVVFRYALHGFVGYAGRYLDAYWGSRFFAEHVMVEALIVVVWGVLCHSRKLNPVPRVWAAGGTIALVALSFVHFKSLDWEIGHTARGKVADRDLALDWTYQPFIRSDGAQPGLAWIQVKRFEDALLPINRHRSDPGLLLRISVSGDPLTLAGSIFEEAGDGSICRSDLANRYCRFKQGPFWYLVHHHTNDAEDMVHAPSLAVLERDVPALFEGSHVREPEFEED